MIALVGATASGKSALALALAERIGAEIISCDSMQVYRELDIGTAKPTAAERARVRHHLVDLLAPDEPFSAARFVAHADEAIAAISGRGRRVLVVGGTGLYLRALRFGLIEAPARDDALRAALMAEERTHPGRLWRRLNEVDPGAARRIAPADEVRIVRALEVFTLTGVPLSRHHAAHHRRPRHPLAVLVLDPPLEVLRPRIAARARAMLAGGLVDETRAVVARYGEGLRALDAVGYREVAAHLAGRLPARALEGAIVAATVRYARRQRTWFNKEPDAMHHPDVDALTAAALAAADGSAL
jgi:tRNA dimethylallyltransferase